MEWILTGLLLLVGIGASFAPKSLPISTDFLAPVFLWSYLLIPVLLRKSPPLPAGGPPIWVRRAMFFLGGVLKERFIALLLLTAASAWLIYQSYPAKYGSPMFWLVVPHRLATAAGYLLPNLLFAFLLLSFPLRRWRWLVVGAVIEVAALVLLGATVWLILRLVALSIVAMVCEVRSERGMPLLPARDLVEEITDVPWILEDAANSPVARRIRAGWLSWAAPVAVFAGSIAVLRGTGILAGGDAYIILASTIGVSFMTFLWSAAAELQKLRERDVLLELLLTEITREDILGAIALKCLRPVLVLVPLSYVALFLYNYGIESGSMFDQAYTAGLLLLICLGSVAVALLIVGPLMNRALRSNSPWFTILGTVGSVIGIVLLCVVAIAFLSMMQASGVGASGDAFARGVLVPAAFVMLAVAWSYVQWQQLLRDFMPIAVGEWRPKALATREEVSHFRRLLGRKRGAAEVG